MFSGIVESIGIIQSIERADQLIHLAITPQMIFDDVKIGDSIAVNGVCLTVTKMEANTFSFTAVPETMRVTNLGDLTVGSCVNLERSLAYNARIGGHYVQGHVDTVSEIISIDKDGDEVLLVKMSIPSNFSKYLVDKGYITIDGMSITLIKATEDYFTVTFIPHTQQVTTVQFYQVGTRINIEVDIMSKYAEKLLRAG